MATAYTSQPIRGGFLTSTKWATANSWPPRSCAGGSSEVLRMRTTKDLRRNGLSGAIHLQIYWLLLSGADLARRENCGSQIPLHRTHLRYKKAAKTKGSLRGHLPSSQTQEQEEEDLSVRRPNTPTTPTHPKTTTHSREKIHGDRFTYDVFSLRLRTTVSNRERAGYNTSRQDIEGSAPSSSAPLSPGAKALLSFLLHTVAS